MPPYIAKPIFNEASYHETAPARRRFFHPWLGAVVRQWQRRRMIKALEALDDRLLHDIGLHRGDIENVVDGFDDRELRMVPVTPATPITRLEPEAYRKAA